SRSACRASSCASSGWRSGSPRNTMQCPGCQHENKPAARFCEACGSRLARACPSCGEEAGPQARFCAACGATLAHVESREVNVESRRDSDADLATVNSSTSPGERRQLTVLFCDLVGSTEIASRLDPEDWHKLSKEYQQAAAAA